MMSYGSYSGCSRQGVLKMRMVIKHIFLILALSPSFVPAADCPQKILPVTSGDPKVPLKILSHQLKPLTKCELEVEADSWLSLLQEKVSELSKAEISVLMKQPDASGQAIDSKELQEDKPASVKRVISLKNERTSRIERVSVVLSELKLKGGDVKHYENYVKSVSGIKVDVTDASAAWTTLTSWAISSEGGLRWATNFFQFTVLIIIFYILSLFVGKTVEKAFRNSQKLSTLLREFLILSTRRIILIVGFFVALSALGINIGPVLAIVGAAGFVIAFALQNSLSNFASGILMLVYRPFDTGEVIKVAGIIGKVESMNLLSTQLRTPDNQLVVVPNNSVWGDVIVNVTGITQRRVDLVFGIGYSDDVEKAQTILEDIVNNDIRVLKDPKPVVKLHELGDSSVNFVCRPWVKPDDYWDVYWDTTKAVKLRFDKAGISIPFPQRDVHIHQT